MSNKRLKITRVMEGVYVFEELKGINMWLAEGEKNCLLIDTGYGTIDLKHEICALTEKPLIVVNSHFHPDHSFGNNQFDQVCCGKSDASDAQAPVSAAFKKDVLLNCPDLVRAGYTLDNWNPGPSQKVVPLQDGDVLSLGGNDIEVYEVPGHTIGSLAFLDRRHRLLFSGDTILSWPVWGHLSNSASLSVYHESLEKIASLGPYYDYLAAGHTGAGQQYLMDKQYAAVFAKGTRKILDGKVTGSIEKTMLGDGLRVAFDEGGGIIYNPDRL